MNFLIGGTAGVSFLTQYTTTLTFGPIFFVINIPFYVQAFKKLGCDFTLKTFIAVSVDSFLTETIPVWFEFGDIEPWFAAIFAGFLIGSGLLMLFRHKASLGGLNILSIYVKEYFQISVENFRWWQTHSSSLPHSLLWTGNRWRFPFLQRLHLT